MTRIGSALLLLSAALHWPTKAHADTAGTTAAATNVATRQVDSFADLRNEVLNTIGGATKRVWLSTDFLSDGEIVSALYIAQYRKVSVQVLLGRSKANSYMSRLNYLKAQNIPVWLKPPTMQGKAFAPTMLLADDVLLQINGELDFLARNRKFSLVVAPPDSVEAFANAFKAASEQAIPAKATFVPLVGRARHEGRDIPPPRGGAAWRPKDSAGNTNPGTSGIVDAEGTYRYGAAREARPVGVADKLPKATKLQQVGRSSDSATHADSRPVLTTGGRSTIDTPPIGSPTGVIESDLTVEEQQQSPPTPAPTRGKDPS